MTLVSGGEASLCERFGVSRTVVRESLRQLESESLITLLPNRGPIVMVLPRHDIESLYEVRRSLGGLDGELFARRASDGLAESMRCLWDAETGFGDLGLRLRGGSMVG